MDQNHTIKANVYKSGKKLKDLLLELRDKFPTLDFPKLSRIINGYDFPPDGFEMEVTRILKRWSERHS